MNKSYILIGIIIIVTIAVSSLFAINNGMAQTGNDEIKRRAFDDVVDMVTEAFLDDDVSIVLCKVPVTGKYPPSIFESEDKLRKHSRMKTQMMLRRAQVIDILRGIDDIDSLFYLSKTFVIREGKGRYLPPVSLPKDSEWILFLNSPFLMTNPYDVSLMEKYEKMDLQEFLNPRNFFSLYAMGDGGLCTYCPENAKYPPKFTYSEGMVDDFRTIIELQENRSLLSESSDSYENYYNSIQEKLGKRVFSQVFVSVVNGQDAELKDRFESEYRAWKEYVEEHSFSSAPQYNEHMFEIVKMGAPVLPLIIEKMEKNEFKMDFLLERAIYSISRKNFEKEDWPEGRRGGSHAAAAMYIDWWHNGLKDTQNSFDRYYQGWKRYLVEKKEEEAEAKLLSIKKLGIAAIPFMIEKIKEGDLEFIKIISDHTNESLSENASKDECIDWWNENKDKYTIVKDQ